jgi:hypothetical protein
MPSPIHPQDVQRALVALGVSQQDFETIRRVPFPQAQTLLQELKTKARRNYKKLAFELHPDRTQGDETKAQLFVLLGHVLGELDKTTVRPPQPQPAFAFTVTATTATWQAWQQGVPSASTGNANAGFSPAQVIRIVKMRPR